MKKSFALILIVSIVLLGAAFGLKGITQKNAQKEHIKLMQTLLPEGENFVKLEYTGNDKNIRSVHKAEGGFVIETAKKGYVDQITMLIGVDTEGKVTGLVVLNAHETEGLGNNILKDDKFLSQFLNKNDKFEMDDSQNGIDGISGATVSSKTVVDCVNSAVAYVTGKDTDADSSATEWEG